MAQKDVEDEEEVYMDEDSDEVVSDGEIPEEGIEEGEEAKTMTRNAGTDDIVAVDMYLEEAVEIPVKAATD